MRTAITLLVLCLVPLFGQAVKVVGFDSNSITIEWALSSYEIEQIQGADGLYHQIKAAGWTTMAEPGHPELPVRGILVQLPRYGEARVELDTTAEKFLGNYSVYPAEKQKVSSHGEDYSEFYKNEEIYQSSNFIPENHVSIGKKQILRGACIARVSIYPFRWNPTSKELRLLDKARFKINFDYSLTQGRDQGHAGNVYQNLLQNNIVNYQPGNLEQTRDFPSLSDFRAEALKIEITTDGIYRITRNDMINAGIDPDVIAPGTYQLFKEGQEQPIKIALQGGTFDYIEFFARAIDNHLTGTMVYWLYWGQTQGLRIKQENYSGRGTSFQDFSERLHFEQNKAIFLATAGAPEKDYFFWDFIIAPASKDYTINIANLSTTSHDVALNVYFQGMTTTLNYPNHHTVVYVNGVKVGDGYWSNTVESLQRYIFSSGLLHNGSNTISISVPGDTGAPVDSVALNWIRIEYRRQLDANGKSLEFLLDPGAGKVEIAGLPSADVVAYQLSSPAKEISGIKVIPDGADYRASFVQAGNSYKNYYITTEEQITAPASMTYWTFADLKNTANGADYLVITAREFAAEAEKLCQYRRTQGLRARVVAVEDIYAEFNYGMFHAKAIKAFLKYAYNNWQSPAPTYVLLMGDANIDHRDYYKTGKRNFVPTYHSPTKEMALIADDNWFACVAGDDALPDMLIGRVPSADISTSSDIVNKLIGYEAVDAVPNRILFSADNDNLGFESTSENLKRAILKHFTTDTVYLRSYGNVADARQDVINSFNSGIFLASYVGHAAVDRWAGEQLLSSAYIPSLSNGNFPIVVALTCFNCHFSSPFNRSMGEELIAPGDKGAIACISSSGLANNWENDLLGNSIFAKIFKEDILKKKPIGQVFTGAKLNVYANIPHDDIMKKFHLCGDPATMVPAVGK